MKTNKIVSPAAVSGVQKCIRICLQQGTSLGSFPRLPLLQLIFAVVAYGSGKPWKTWEFFLLLFGHPGF